jgi:flagellar biosynthesis protein FliR
MELTFREAEIAGYLLALVRAGAWIAIAPPFGGRVLPMQVKAGFAVALSLAVGPKLAEAGVPLEPGPLISGAVMQAVAGLALGYIGVLVLGVVQAAGALVDSLAGFSMATLFDPTTSTQTTVFGRFYQLLGITLLFAIDGHILLVRGFLTSIDAAPFTTLDIDALHHVLTDGLGNFLLAAMEISAPLLAALLAAELAIALLAKAAPQANAFLLGIPVKILVVMSLGALALPRVAVAMHGLLETITRDGMQVVAGGG